MAKKPKRPEEPKDTTAEDAFAMLFTALNLILLSFFILLNAISIKDSDRQRKAIGSLRGTFGILAGGENPWADGEHMTRSDKIELTKAKGRDLVAKRLAMVMRRPGLYRGTAGVVLVQTSSGLRLDLTEPVLFRPGRVEVHPRLFPLLDALGQEIERAQRPVIVRGYTDAGRPHNFPSNLALSTSRAAEVARYFVRAAGVSARLVQAEGRGVRRGDRARRVVEIFMPEPSLSGRLGGGA